MKFSSYKTIYLIGLIVMFLLLISLIFLIIILFLTKSKFLNKKIFWLLKSLVFIVNPNPSVQLPITPLSTLNSLQPISIPLSSQTPTLLINGDTNPINNNSFNQAKNLNTLGQHSNSWIHNSKMSNNAVAKQLQSRIFKCDFYIHKQANPAYDNLVNFEYNQAMQIVQNAVI